MVALVFLDLASAQHPSVLSKFRLDIYSLKSRGLASVQSIIQRSSLEYLHIVCNSIQERDQKDVRRTLASINRLSIKSLVFEGDAIEEWIGAWRVGGKFPDFAMERLKLIGASGQNFRWSTCIYVAHMIRTEQLKELHMKNFRRCHWLEAHGGTGTLIVAILTGSRKLSDFMYLQRNRVRQDSRVQQKSRVLKRSPKASLDI